ncbi:GNAT family N-acetyltransferase [Proteus faecis]|uniref:GNAT family N-acetyltransferase n=1 Tax=Proteus faecis TaxID=2050967 RepID=A0AAW7CJJ9_9GAMM|nr:GNAT family N-acetyltransferase [Proteus faecis]MBG3012263.1 GNAT family N-acetyltransferase [Proteus mirabilis]NBN60391.1 GNAT family N-acetyltransferase [Proteus sp. G2639]MDL5166699.1 GNAT family N-acetyltransferase [Proteus faecis]MDL5274666.1 GNAT family N-acetyltransferase [Proteus faecis]MDL5278253.1 GNAT family N-acetyltransferase [Proteus faecis]
MNWILKSFSQLTTDELYAILALRNQVFICEQQCAYQDLDGVDQNTLHLFAKEEDSQQLIAYARLLPQGIAFKEASIGRVIVAQKQRGRGIAHQLIKEAIATTCHQFNTHTIKIMAQVYLVSFYQSHGFVIDSETYLEDNIPHIDMVLVQSVQSMSM